MAEKEGKNNLSKDREETENTQNEASINKLVSHLKENPKLKDFDEEQLKAIAKEFIITEQYYSSFSGPLPPPKTLEGYEQILPGAADRIIKMAEQNANNRLNLDNKIVEADIKRSNKGQYLGFILSVLFIGAAILCAYLDQPFPASVLGIGGFSSIISIFVLGRK